MAGELTLLACCSGSLTGPLLIGHSTASLQPMMTSPNTIPMSPPSLLTLMLRPTVKSTTLLLAKTPINF